MNCSFRRLSHILYIIALCCGGSLAIQSCGSNGGSSDGDESVAESVEIIRLDRAIAAGSDTIATSPRLQPGYEALRLFQGYTGVPDSLLSIAAMSQSPAVTIFQPDVERMLPSLDSIERQLGGVRSRLATILPDVEFPAVYAVVLPSRDHTMVIVDTVMLVGLNHYLGSDYEGYNSFENYQRAVKEPSRLPIDAAREILYKNYPYTPASTTTPAVINRLLYEGAIAAALCQLFPQLEPATVMGYTPQEWQWLTANEAPGWNSLIANSLLYSTDPVVASRLVNPAPSTPLLHPEAPGRAGVYYGYRIAGAYLDNAEGATLPALLSPAYYSDDASAIRLSRYSPK